MATTQQHHNHDPQRTDAPRATPRRDGLCPQCHVWPATLTLRGRAVCDVCFACGLNRIALGKEPR